ncbi:hypothetical protein [Halorubrum vacuolatum]|uniref:Uncharacterized protein n=1 Tax=Halorubrum vacuolatum TaxID=63740 RepID=A0A238VA69_HALVU|nr:hypothetical protein [Halorubrum vacuolatum]SNR31332.1 hypothetical protein SAMN06264855_102168 [Halorubrum vacuolatum]
MSAESDPDSGPGTDGGYVHTPDGERVDTGPDEPAADGFGRQGWALTAALIVCVLVIPGIIYAYPYAAGSFGLSFFGTYLVLPLIPAVLLGLIAVWSMTAATAADGDR